MVDFPTPQRAVILAAGFGSRLRPLTDLRPKPLVEVNGVSILHNALSHLGSVGVRDVTIVVGYRKDAIQYAFGHQFHDLRISYVESTVFDRTGSAYSLWLARDALLDGDSYLLEGDVFFEQEALRRLKDSDAANAAAVAPFDKRMEGSAAVLDPADAISAIRTKQTFDSLQSSGAARCFKTVNLMRFSGETLRSAVVPALDHLFNSGVSKTYVEELLAQLIERGDLGLRAIHCGDIRWYEIDDTADLRVAEAIFSDANNVTRAAASAR